MKIVLELLLVLIIVPKCACRWGRVTSATCSSSSFTSSKYSIWRSSPAADRARSQRFNTFVSLALTARQIRRLNLHHSHGHTCLRIHFHFGGKWVKRICKGKIEWVTGRKMYLMTDLWSEKEESKHPSWTLNFRRSGSRSIKRMNQQVARESKLLCENEQLLLN